MRTATLNKRLDQIEGEIQRLKKRNVNVHIGDRFDSNIFDLVIRSNEAVEGENYLFIGSIPTSNVHIPMLVKPVDNAYICTGNFKDVENLSTKWVFVE